MIKMHLQAVNFWWVCTTCIFTLSKGDFNPVGSIDCGDTAYGSIDSYEIANYTFSLTEEYPIVQISTCGSDYDTWLYLWDSNGDLIDDCDDCGNCNVRTILTLDDLDTGDYYIGVGGYYDDAGIYVLDVTCFDVTGAPMTTNVNDTTSYYGGLNCNHYFSVPLPSSCRYYGWRGVDYECIDEYTVGINVYNVGDSDCTGDINSTYIRNITGYASRNNRVSCSYSSSCDYYLYTVLNDSTSSDCSDGNLLINAASVTGQCVSYDARGYSYKYTCHSNGIATSLYSCVDCDSSCLEYQDNSTWTWIYERYEDYCVTFECNDDSGNNGGSSGSGSNNDDGNFIGVPYSTGLFCLFLYFIFY